MTVEHKSSDRQLQPWRALVSLVLLLVMTVVAYCHAIMFCAVGFGFTAGMYLQEWAHRIKDKYGSY